MDGAVEGLTFGPSSPRGCATSVQGVAGCRWKSGMRILEFLLNFVSGVCSGLRSTWERGAGRAWIEEVEEEYAEVESHL